MEQSTILTNEEITLAKKIFAEKEFKIMAIRKSFYQLPLSGEEQDILKSLDEDALTLIDKVICPKIDGTQRLRLTADLWSAVDGDFKDRLAEDCILYIKGRALLIDYLVQQVEELKSGKPNELKERILFNEMTDVKTVNEDTFINLIARNAIVKHIENQLSFLLVIAGKKEETAEDTIKRLKLNSAK